MMRATGKILIVDDEPSIRFFLEEVLERDGHRVTTVESGEAALEQIAEQDFDLVLLDLMMKGIGGMEVLYRLGECAPNTVAIVLTAHGSLETAVEALRHGAHDYLFKPCKVVELRESVRTGLIKRRQELQRQGLLSQLERSLANSLAEIRATAKDPSAASPSPSPEPMAPDVPSADEGRFLQREGLIVDFMRHVITLDDHLLELSPTEFDILALLISEAPRVLTPQELVSESRGYDIEPWDARDMVRHHIYRIRKKIRAVTGHSDVIRTVRGVGYALGE